MTGGDCGAAMLGMACAMTLGAARTLSARALTTHTLWLFSVSTVRTSAQAATAPSNTTAAGSIHQRLTGGSTVKTIVEVARVVIVRALEAASRSA